MSALDTFADGFEVPLHRSLTEPILLGGGKQLLMGNLIQTQFGGGRNWPFGAAIAVVLMVLVMIFLMVNALRARPSRRSLPAAQVFRRGAISASRIGGRRVR